MLQFPYQDEPAVKRNRAEYRSGTVREISEYLLGKHPEGKEFENVLDGHA